MPYHLNGQCFEKALPISRISVNKNTIVFTDKSGQQRIALDSVKKRDDFLNWLVN